MNKPEVVETREAMLATAAATGFHPSDVQLKAWRRERLIPKPVRQRGQGQGQGSTTVYPAGSGAQLVALGRARQRDRQLHRIAFLLWWEGFPIDFEIVRAALLTELQTMDEALGRFRDGDEISEEGWQILDRMQEEPRVPKPMRRARKRVGKASFSTVMRILLDAAAGQTVESEDPYEDEPDSALIARAVGLPFLNQFLATGGGKPISEDDAALAVTSTGAIANVTAIETLITRIPESEAIAARTDFRAFVQFLKDLRYLGANTERFLNALSRKGMLSASDPFALLRLTGLSAIVSALLPADEDPSPSEMMWLFGAGLGLWRNGEMRGGLHTLLTTSEGIHEARVAAEAYVGSDEVRTSNGDCSHE